MDQKKIEMILKIRRISYFVIAVLSLSGVLLSAFHGFLSNYPIVLYAVIIGLVGLCIASLYLYLWNKNRGSVGHLRNDGEKHNISKKLLLISLIIAVFEVAFIVKFPDLDGVLVVLMVGVAFATAVSIRVKFSVPSR